MLNGLRGPRRTLWRGSLVASAGALALTAAGCGGGGESTADSPSGVAAAEVLPARQGAGGAGLAPLTGDEKFFLDQATMMLTQSCMKKAGLHYTVPADVGHSTRSSDDPTPDELARGYSIGKGEYVEERGDDSPDTKGMSEADQKKWREALLGDESSQTEVRFPDNSTIGESTGGCYGEARKQIYGSVAAAIVSDHAPSFLSGGKALEAISQRSDYRAVADKWRACLAAKGFQVDRDTDTGLAEAIRMYSSKGQAQGDAYAAALAPADAACMRATGIHDVRARLLAEHAATLKSTQGLDSASLMALQRTAVDRARNVVLGHGSGA